jgi:nucleoside phosphorylase
MNADVAILTVIPEAHDAVRQLCSLSRSEERGGQPYWTGRVPAAGGGEHLVVLDRAVDRSNLPAQEAAQRLLQHWRPRHLIVADIGGGFHGRDGLAVGDVVFASLVHYYEFVKETAGGGVEARDFARAAPARGARATLAVIAQEATWPERIEHARPGGTRDWPSLLEGEIVAGDHLLSDPDSSLVAGLVGAYPKALAIDMESAGVARAVYGAQQDELFTQLTILRGISDLVDDPERDNQATRDDWKPYAAHAAAAAALRLVTRTRLPQHADDELPSIVRRHRECFQDSLRERLPTDAQSFRLELRSARRGETAPHPPAAAPETFGRDQLLELLDRERRIALYGSSGAGKSWTLLHLARQIAPGDDPLAVLVDLKAFRPTWLGQIADTPVGERLVPAIDAILSAAIEPISATELDALAQERTVVLLVDGINEVPEVNERMRIALNEYARQRPRVRVLVADRRAELFYRDARWKLIGCHGLVHADARAVVDERFGAGTFEALPAVDRELLELPFFLDWALEIGDPRLAPRAHAVDRFLRRSGLSDVDLDRIAQVAYTASAAQRTALAESEQCQLEADGLLDRLHAAGIVVHRGADQRFAHQLFHQYAAARWVAHHDELWTPQALDEITVNAASLDAIGMTLTLTTAKARDRLLRVVYDWNWRAAIQALHETQSSDCHVSHALEIAVLAMAAEKRFDPVAGTAMRVHEQLERFEDGIAARLRDVTDHEELLQLIASLQVDAAPWYAEWKAVFLNRPTHGSLDDEAIVQVISAEPLLGWTTANTIRRFPCDEGHAAQLRALYLAHRPTSQDRLADTIRWRIVHALGRWPSQANVALLQRSLDEDADLWVRYGAMRSLMEMAALSTDGLRTEILADLRARITTLDRLPLTQVAWSASYHNAHEGWIDAVRPLLTAVLAAQESDTERELWRRRLDRFERYAEAQR